MPPSDWERDKAASDVFEPEVRRILADYFIKPATLKEDQEEATDLKVFTVAPLTVAWRNRGLKYLDSYPFDITIRYARRSGVRTEWDKIVDGWGHFFLYTFGDPATKRVIAWRLIDLDAFRAQLIRGGTTRSDDKTGAIRITADKPNVDGASFLRALDTRSFAPNVEVAKWRDGQVAA